MRRRCEGEPLEVVVGWTDFGGLRIRCAPGVFVPRRRSELLVRTARALRPASVVDVCCGTGALGLAVVTGTGASLVAADVDLAAVSCARANGVDAFCGDLFAPLPPGTVADVVVANAPYVPSDDLRLLPAEARDHEPATALDGGADGLDVHRRVAALAPAYLEPGGHVLVEVTTAQAPAAQGLFAAAGFATLAVTDDDLGATVVVAQKGPVASQPSCTAIVRSLGESG